MTRHLYPPELEQADRACDAAISDAAAAIRDADAAIHDFDTIDQATNEEIAELRALVFRRGPTPEWLHVIARIEMHELSWEGLASGRFSLDPGVRAAYDSLRALPPIEEDVPDNEDGRENKKIRRANKEEISDEDYFDNFDPFRN